jgi:DnaJ-class molecular chaperone
MAEDLYSILGVSRRASDDEIRRAFRTLAKANHPDVNPGNNAAAERFKKITAANDILGDADKRRAYDSGEIDEKGDARRPMWSRPGAGRGPGQTRGARPGGGFDDFSFANVFGDVFGGAGPRGPGFSGAARGQDLRYALEVDFMEAVSGVKKRVTLPDGHTLELVVPEGVQDGQVLRLKGKGTPGVGGIEDGDALVEIKIKSHPDFKRQGDDVLVDVPITLDEAVLGGRIEVATASGRVQLTLPKGTSSGKVFRLKGKGVRTRTGGYGDQLFTIRIVMPNEIDDSLSYFFSEWRQKNTYDPGRK